MTETNITTQQFNAHNTFGGLIDIDDFNPFTPNKKRINNQIDANNLQNHLEKQKKKKDEENHITMTLEELREMRIVSNTNGRPLPNLTDEKWQKEFNVRKIFIKSYDKTYKKMRAKFSKESGHWNEEKYDTYHGKTKWQEYCSYINDVLSVIRSGKIDYCYFIYQIEDLLKFHLNDLKTKYCDGYWEVWLEQTERNI